MNNRSLTISQIMGGGGNRVSHLAANAKTSL